MFGDGHRKSLRLLQWGATALLALSLATTGARAEDSSSPRSCGFSGRVLSEGGAGLSGAEVAVTGPRDGAPLRVVTGEHGIYQVTGLPGGVYSLEVWVSGTRRLQVGPVTLAAGETRVQNFELPLDFQGSTLEVVAEANRDELASEQLLQCGARDVAEALPQMPGFWKVRKGGIANDVVLRGYQGENLNVLIDGVRVQGACPNNMDPTTFHVDLSEVRSVEVSRGPFDVRNVGSLGGAVNVVTQKPQQGLGLRASLAVGSFSFLNPSASVSHGGEKVSLQAGASLRSSDAYEDGRGRRFTELGGYRTSAQGSDAFRVKTGWAGAFLSPTPRDHFRLTYSRQEADHVLYPYLLMDGVFDNTDRVQAGYERTPESGALKALRVQAYATRVGHWMTDGLRTSSSMAPRGYSMGTDAQTRAFGGRVETEWSLLTVGFETTRREWDTQTLMAGSAYAPQHSIPGVEAQTAGLYGTHIWSLSGAWSLRAGARVDRFRSAADPQKANTGLYYAYHGTRDTSSDHTGASGHVRLLWTPSAALEVAAGVGSVQRFPDPQELFFGLRRMGADWVGNPDLKPARNTGADLGLSYQRPGLLLKANLYRDRVQDFIAVYDQRKIHAVPGVMNPVARSYANTDATLWGGELSASLAVGGSFFLSADAAFVRGTQEARPELGIAAGDLAEMPPLTGRAAVRYDDGRYFAEVEGVFAARQDRVDTDLREASTPGWGVCHLRCGAKWKGFSLTLAANNLFDRYYVEHLSYQRDPFRSDVRVPEPGRSVTLTLSWKL